MPGEGIDVSPLMSAEEARQKMDPRTIEVALSREDPFTGFGTSLAEARTLVSFISLTGVAYPLTSIMSRLPEERVRLLSTFSAEVQILRGIRLSIPLLTFIYIIIRKFWT